MNQRIKYIGNSSLGIIIPFRYALSYFILGTIMIDKVISEIVFENYIFGLNQIYEEII